MKCQIEMEVPLDGEVVNVTVTWVEKPDTEDLKFRNQWVVEWHYTDFAPSTYDETTDDTVSWLVIEKLKEMDNA